MDDEKNILIIGVLFILLSILFGCQTNQTISNNIYDPKLISIGDTVGEFRLESINYTAGTDDYPFDTVSAQFEGSARLTGSLEYHETDREFSSDAILLFMPDNNSLQKIPIKHHEEAFSGIVFTNDEFLVNKLNLVPGQKVNQIIIEISGYKKQFLATDAYNLTTILKIIE